RRVRDGRAARRERALRAGATRLGGSSPAELDLDLRTVGAHLELEGELDLVGHVDRVAQPLALERDLVVARQLVGELAQALRRLLAAEPRPGLVLDELHGGPPVVVCARRSSRDPRLRSPA